MTANDTSTIETTEAVNPDGELRQGLFAAQAARIVELQAEIASRQEEIDNLKSLILDSHPVGTYQAGNVRFVLISPDELKTPQYVIDRINATDSCSYVEVRDLASVIGDLDVLYMTRVQKERFFNEDDYLRLRDTYILDEEKLQLAKPSMAVLHPLPRVNEIAVDVDDDPCAAYFEQVKNGMLVRMALESTVVGDELPGYEPLNPKEVQA